MQNHALYRIYAENPRNVEPFLVRLPLKRDIQQKLQFSTPLCTNCVRGWCPRYGAFLEGLVFYQREVVRLLYLRKFVRPVAHSGGMPENLTLPGGQI